MTGPMNPSPFAQLGVTCEQASAALSALSCPTGHANRAPVVIAITGEQVATLCLDCDRQPPAEWKTSRER